MASKLELGLDDIIKTNKKANKKVGGGNRGGKASARGGAKGTKGSRPNGIKRLNSQSPLKNRSMNGKWQHDKAAIVKPPPGPAKLSVANLDFGVNDQDINELFSRCGHIIKAHVHYDANGRSQGTADVVFRSHKEASAAVNEYNGRLLDGRPMDVQIVGAAASKPASLASRIGAANTRSGNRPKRGGRTGTTNGNSNGAVRGGKPARGGRGGGRGGKGGRSAAPPVTKEDLDKQMEEYRMQTDTA